MKSIQVGTGVFAVLFFLILGCQSSKEEKAVEVEESHEVPSSAPREWKEMDNFHMVMAEVFHPYKDSADLKPAKEMAKELSAAAREWKGSEVPAGLDPDKISKKLSELTILTAEFEREVQEQSDEAIGEKLTVLHDLFHDLQDEFYHSGKHAH